MGVEAAGPRGAGPGQADRSDQGDHGHDHPEDRQPRLALGQREEGEEEVARDRQDDVYAVLRLALGHAVHTEGREAGENQPDQGRGEHHDLHALAPRLGPVDVVEVQDQRELVEDEPRPDAEDHRRERRPEPLPASRDRGEAADDGEHHAGDHVMDVHPARLDVPEGPLTRPDQTGDDPGDHERQHERRQREEQRQLARFHDVALPPLSHMRTLSPGPVNAPASAG